MNPVGMWTITAAGYHQRTFEVGCAVPHGYEPCERVGGEAGPAGVGGSEATVSGKAVNLLGLGVLRGDLKRSRFFVFDIGQPDEYEF